VAVNRGNFHDLKVVTSTLPGLVRLPVSTATAGRDAGFAQLRQNTQLSPQSAEALVQLGYGCLLRERWHEASAVFQSALRLDPECAAALLGGWDAQAQLTYPDGTLRLAQMLAQLSASEPQGRGALEQADRHFQESLAQSPREPWLVLRRALCAALLGDEPTTESQLTALQLLAPRELPARFLLADALRKMGHITPALQQCQRFVAEAPTHAGGALLLGRLLLASNQLETALAAFAQTGRLRPDWGYPRLLAAEVCGQLEQFPEAFQWADEAARFPSTAHQAQLIRAALHGAAGQHAAAEKIYRAALQAAPENLMALNNLAEELAWQDKFAEALALTEKLVALYPSVPAVNDTAGWVNLRAGNLEPAAKHLHQALRLAPRLAPAWLHLGQLLQAQQRPTEAATAVRRALDLGLSPSDKRAALLSLTNSPPPVSQP
jgi:tetratricopeptide (TPR) repeat protein